MLSLLLSVIIVITICPICFYALAEILAPQNRYLNYQTESNYLTYSNFYITNGNYVTSSDFVTNSNYSIPPEKTRTGNYLTLSNYDKEPTFLTVSNYSGIDYYQPDSYVTWADYLPDTYRFYNLPDDVIEYNYETFSFLINTRTKVMRVVGSGDVFGLNIIENSSIWSDIELLFIDEEITAFGANIFHNCNDLRYIFYSGSVQDWNNLYKSKNNEGLLSATVFYDCVFNKPDYQASNTNHSYLEFLDEEYLAENYPDFLPYTEPSYNLNELLSNTILIASDTCGSEAYWELVKTQDGLNCLSV